jgi:hypothetical protein
MTFAETFQKAVAVEGASEELAKSIDKGVKLEIGKGFNKGVIFYHFTDHSAIAYRSQS